METIIACADEEIARKIDEALYFKSLLTKTIKERDEFRFKSQILVSKNLVLQQEIQKLEANLSSFVRAARTSYIEDDPIVQVVSSLVSNENSTKTQLTDQISLLSLPLPPSQPLTYVIDNVVLTKRLPEKGKFLHAMMKSGPLLQNLLLVGHLPQWRNPPPKLNSIKIPQVTIPSSFMRCMALIFLNNQHQESKRCSPITIENLVTNVLIPSQTFTAHIVITESLLPSQRKGMKAVLF
ncbi:unnamed protein product [Lactuca virosa]|uniref:Hexosyltransferase n=1 Tax=Lactuca virosa TaxID=75947 RepID=A0AAU9NB44_9ASTR|nr:unnamed protein product [Lactuca virosa]